MVKHIQRKTERFKNISGSTLQDKAINYLPSDQILKQIDLKQLKIFCDQLLEPHFPEQGNVIFKLNSKVVKISCNMSAAAMPLPQNEGQQFTSVNSGGKKEKSTFDMNISQQPKVPAGNSSQIYKKSFDKSSISDSRRLSMDEVTQLARSHMPISEILLKRVRENDPALTYLNLSGQGITDDDIEVLVSAMKTNSNLKHINLNKYKEVMEQECVNEDDYLRKTVTFNWPVQEGSSPNKVTERGAKLLAGLKSIESLNISNNLINDEGALYLSRSHSIRKLTANNCNISNEGAKNFLYSENLEDLLLMCNPFDQREVDWFNELLSVLTRNKCKRTPQCRERIAKEQEKERIEKAVMQAIDDEDIAQLNILVPQLKHGVNTRLDYGATLLMYAVDKYLPVVLEHFLKIGARIESHEREYTPLFKAAENCRLEIVELLLEYGSNINGEFFFNSETALSIAAFKFCHAFTWELKKINFDDFEATFDERFSDNKYNLTFEQLKIDVDNLLNCWDALVQSGDVPWVMFGKSEYLYDQYTNQLLTLFALMKRWLYEYPMDIDEVSNYAKIYYLIFKKIEMLKEKAPSSKLDEEASDIEDDLELTRSISPLVSDAESLEFSCEEELKKVINELNEELKNKTEESIEWSKYPKFFIAQYRGIHYYRSHFTKHQRADHRRTAHLNRIAPAPAVYYMSNLNPTQHQLARESVVEKHRATIQVTFEQLENSGPTTQYWEGSCKKEFNNESDMMQQRMSNKYNAYREDIIKQENRVPKLLCEKNIVGYPHYATSDLPYHALKYAYGQKKIDGLSEWRLRPVFQKNGSLLHPYPGKIYISMFTPLEMCLYKARHVAGMHNRKDIFLAGTVIPERETSIPGGIDSDAPFYEELLVIPSFEKFDESYISKYGITRKTFDDCQKKISKSWENPDPKKRVSLRKSIKNRIIEKIIMRHKQKELLTLAQAEAKRRGGILIYRHYNGEYGLNPEGLRIPSKGSVPFYSENEILLVKTIGKERFDIQIPIKKNTVDTINPKKRKNDDQPDTVGGAKRSALLVPQGFENFIKSLSFELFKNFKFDFAITIEILDECLSLNGLERGKSTTAGNNCLLHSYFQHIEIYFEKNKIDNLGDSKEFFSFIRQQINKVNGQMLSANDEEEGINILKAIQIYLYKKTKRNFGFELKIFVADRDNDFAAVDNLDMIQQQVAQGDFIIPLSIIQVNYNHYEPIFIINKNSAKLGQSTFAKSLPTSRLTFFKQSDIDSSVSEATDIEKAKQESLHDLPELEQANRVVIEQINLEKLEQGVQNSLQG